jgi:hypothetical protein
MDPPHKHGRHRTGHRHRPGNRRGPLRKLWGLRHGLHAKTVVRLAVAAATAGLAFLIWRVLRVLASPPEMP